MLNTVSDLTQELEEEVKRKGARGFNIVMAGDFSPPILLLL
jgi:hypothetical protein